MSVQRQAAVPVGLIETKEKLHFVVHFHFIEMKCNNDSLLCNNSNKKSLFLSTAFEHNIVGVEDFRLKFSKEKTPNTMLSFQTKIQGL